MSNISTWSPVAASNNTAAPNGFPEGMLPSGVNDAAREVMAAVRRWYEDAQWIDIGVTHTRTGAATFTITGDYTATYTAGRKVRMTGSATAVGTISGSVFSSPDTIVTIAESNVPATLATVSISIVSTAGAPQNLSGLFADGTVGAPGVAFFADSNTGLYRSASDTLAIATGGVQRVTVGTAGNVTVNAPSSGDTLTVNTLNAQGLRVQTTAGSSGAAVVFGQTGQSPAAWYQAASFSDLRGFVNGADRVIIGTAGNVTINAPISGAPLTLNTNSGQNSLVAADGTVTYVTALFGSSGASIGTTTNHQLNIATNSLNRVVVAATGNVTINAPSSGVPLSVTSVSGGGPGIQINGASGLSAYLRLRDGGAGNRDFAVTVGTVAAGTFSIFDETAASARISISSTGNLTINAPSSGVHTISGETDARGVAITRIKTADQNISSTITLQNDTHLFCDLTSGRYEFELFLNYRNTATGSAGLQFAFTYSGTALTPVWTYWGTSDGSFIADSLPQLTLTSGPAIATISIFSAGDWAVVKGTFNASTAGTFRFQWAQVSSSANPTVMMQGSSMKLTKLV